MELKSFFDAPLKIAVKTISVSESKGLIITEPLIRKEIEQSILDDAEQGYIIDNRYNPIIDVKDNTIRIIFVLVKEQEKKKKIHNVPFPEHNVG